MADQDSIWFRLGYTLENARLGASPPQRLRSPAERDRRGEARAARKVGAAPTPRPEGEPGPEAEAEGPLGALQQLLQGVSPTGEPWEAVVSAVGAAVVGKMLDAMPRKRRPGPIRLLHAAAAGAGVAVVRELFRPGVSGRALDVPLADRARSAALSGSARGLLYGALIEPRIPGPPAVRGALYGAVEHLLAPLGGLLALAGPRAPHRSLPFVSALFEELEEADETLVDHVLFGVGLAALYGARPADARADDEDDEDDE